MTVFNLALIGECMIELQEISPGTVRQTFGGDTLNTAIYCARLAGQLPMRVTYVTALGTDSFSSRMIDFWEQEGVGSELVQRIDGESPGLYYIETDECGERVFHYWRSTAAAKKCFEYPGSDLVLSTLAEYDAIYLSGISLAILSPRSRKLLIDRLRELARGNTRIIFDCNYRPRLWQSVAVAKAVYAELYRLSEIVFLTTEEAEILLDSADTERVFSTLASFGTKEVVIKDGDKPCTIYHEGKQYRAAAEKVVQVVDTTAAGDSFSGVYLVARYFGCPPQTAVRLAHRTAAYVVAHKGAVAPLGGMPVTGKDIATCARQ